MKTTVKILSLLLALVMLASCFAACGDDSQGDKESDTQATPSDSDVSNVSQLPDTMDWGGEEYTVLGRDGGSESQFTNFEVGYEELPNDVVGKAVYQRNENLKTKYNFTVSPILASQTHITAQTAYDSGDDLYDLVIYQPLYVQAHAQSGYLLNLQDMPHVNLNHSSWYSDVNAELTIGDKLYYTTNDFLLQDKHRFFYCFYNRDMASELGLGYFEDMVDDNTWTLENVVKLTRQAYADADANGPTNTDRYGLACQEYFSFTVFAFSAGFRITEKDNNNYPTLVGATDKMLNILDEVFELTDHNSTWFQQDHSFTNDSDHPEVMFKNGQVLLLQAFTSFIDFFLMDETGIAYGALPNPKLDSSQKNYAVMPNVGNGSFLAIPYTVLDEEFAGFCLEAVTEASTDTSYTAYIDTKCKYQDAYDEDCARMLDLCFSSPVYDIGAFCDFGEIYSNLHAGNNSLASTGHNFYKRTFDAAKSAAQKQIDELKTEYEARA